MTKKTSKPSSTPVTTRRKAKEGAKAAAEAKEPKPKPKASSIQKRMKALPPKGLTPIWIQYYEQEAKDLDTDYGKGYNRPPDFYERLMETYVSCNDTFFDTLQQNPRPTFAELLKAFDNVDPPPNRQQAVTPKFLRALFHNAQTAAPTVRHAADLLIAAFFFACRSCEYVVTPTPGVTRRLKLRNIIFRDAKNRLIHHRDPKLASKATMVTICFENQKNRTQMDRRTHTRTADSVLCPVRRFVSIVQRILQTIPDVSPLTDICTVLNERLQVIQIDNTLTLSLLRSTCDATPKLGFHPQDIGNRSIRSGAAMALFMSRTTPDRIMLLGRWKSTAFMDYIRPQVLQWSLHLAPSMIKFNHFFSTHPPATPTSSTPPTLHTLHHGRPIKIKSFNVDFENVSS